jgi:hypothetical protein
MCDELTSAEAERDSALELLELRTACLVYLANMACHQPCLGCGNILREIFDHLSNPNMTMYREKLEANSHLRIAAPELLRASEAMLASVKGKPSKVFTRLFRAVQKAKGDLG